MMTDDSRPPTTYPFMVHDCNAKLLWPPCVADADIIFIRLEAIASAQYWIHFVVRFNGVHAFGYNSAGSEPIWMKFGAL